MRASHAFRFAAFSVTLGSIAACTLTPDLQFEDAGVEPSDGGLDRAVPAFGGGDDGTDGARDAASPGARDAGDGATSVDAAPPTTKDAGAPRVDAGTPPVDAGTPPVDAGTPPVDAGTPPRSDGGGFPMTCPGAPPAGADLCCGVIPCVGKKCDSQCTACGACAGFVCCVTPNGKAVSCAAAPSECKNGG